MTLAELDRWEAPRFAYARSLATATTLVSGFWLLHHGADARVPSVARQRGKAAGSFSAGTAWFDRMTLGECREGFELSTIAHETAHVLVNSYLDRGIVDPGHGPAFRAAHVHVSRYMLGEDVAKSLEACYRQKALRIDGAFADLLALDWSQAAEARADWREGIETRMAASKGN